MVTRKSSKSKGASPESNESNPIVTNSGAEVFPPTFDRNNKISIAIGHASAIADLIFVYVGEHYEELPSVLEETLPGAMSAILQELKLAKTLLDGSEEVSRA